MSWMIKIEDVSKMYRLGLVSSATLQDDFIRAWYKIRGKEDPFLKIGEENKRDSAGGEYVWALKDINLEVEKGEVLGIIGKNGAGKSTLLKLLSKVTKPTTGSIKTKGRIASLLEVGTGFHPELTGRENIFLNGAILGMKKYEIRSKFDEIVDFSGCERYIDTPVKRYSSGMHVRLAFAVAAYLDPEILVVDEVLAVGDAEFQQKAIGKMKDVSKGEGRTVLFVSHNMSSINTLCNKAIFMKNGTINKIGNVTEIVNYYQNESFFNQKFGINEKSLISPLTHSSNNYFKLLNISLDSYNFSSNESNTLNIKLNTLKYCKELQIYFTISTMENHNFLGSSIYDNIQHQKITNLKPSSYSFKCTLPKNIFSSKVYYLTLNIRESNLCHYTYENIIKFNVNFFGYNNYNNPVRNHSNLTLRPKFKWEINEN